MQNSNEFKHTYFKYGILALAGIILSLICTCITLFMPTQTYRYKIVIDDEIAFEKDYSFSVYESMVSVIGFDDKPKAYVSSSSLNTNVKKM